MTSRHLASIISVANSRGVDARGCRASGTGFSHCLTEGLAGGLALQDHGLIRGCLANSEEAGRVGVKDHISQLPTLAVRLPSTFSGTGRSDLSADPDDEESIVQLDLVSV